VDFSKSCILIVDDSPFIIRNLAKTLQADYKVIGASSGEEACQLLKLEKIDLVLLDIVLPDLNGYDICRYIKNNNNTRHIPVIFISGNGAMENQVNGFSLGAIDFMVKPLCMPILKAKISNYLKLKRRTDELARLSLFDELTHIANRRSFNRTLKHEWEYALRKHRFLGLLFLDIDFFKAYNDFYGHLAGDSCLQKVAKAIGESLSCGTDQVARYGGEEFTVILPNTTLAGAFEIAQNINNTIADLKIPHETSKINPYITVSIGAISMIPTESFTSAEFIDKADKAMYKSKERGRNTIVYC
jgi:diguanylate cyclase (GGDEF)-like protein